GRSPLHRSQPGGCARRASCHVSFRLYVLGLTEHDCDGARCREVWNITKRRSHLRGLERTLERWHVVEVHVRDQMKGRRTAVFHLAHVTEPDLPDAGYSPSDGNVDSSVVIIVGGRVRRRPVERDDPDHGSPPLWIL